MHGRCITRIIPRAFLGRLHLILLCVATLCSSSARYQSTYFVVNATLVFNSCSILKQWDILYLEYRNVLSRLYIRIILVIDYKMITC